jgi:hypothetical protein
VTVIKPPYSRALRAFPILTVVFLVLFLVGFRPTLLGVTLQLGRNVQTIGLVGATFFGLLWLGVGVYAHNLRAALKKMYEGGVFGEWSLRRDGRLVTVTVGPRLSVVGERLCPYAVHLQHVKHVELDESSRQLRIHGHYNYGEGNSGFQRQLPFEARDLDQVRHSGQKLAAHHKVSFEQH